MREEKKKRRVVFYQLALLHEDPERTRALELIKRQRDAPSLLSLNDALELHHAIQFVEHRAFPSSASEEEQAELLQTRGVMNRELSKYFLGLGAANFSSALDGLEREYMMSLVDLLLRYKSPQNMHKGQVVEELTAVGVPLWMLLSSKKFVEVYDAALRILLLAEPSQAEIWIQKRLVHEASDRSFLPPSLTDEDVQAWLNAYIQSERAHLNLVQVIAEAPNEMKSIVTKKIRLAAKRRAEELGEALLEDESAVVSRIAFGAAIDQLTPMKRRWEQKADGTVILHLGEKHLLKTLENLAVIENFASTLQFMEGAWLWMPSYKSELSALHQLGIDGVKAYLRGPGFERKDALTSLGLSLYHSFLEQNGVVLEEVLAWFFNNYLADEFGAAGFHYSPPTPGSSWLEKIRHLAPEMEGIAQQFTLFCQENEIDRELFEIGSGDFNWGSIPSLRANKYLIGTPKSDCNLLMWLLFNDQSGLTYISEVVSESSFERLVNTLDVAFEDLNPFVESRLQPLLDHELLSVEDGILRFPYPEQILVLHDLYAKEGVPLYRYSGSLERAAVALTSKGLLVPTSRLMTLAESHYFEYWLNKNIFSDGPELRNKYSHGNNPDPSRIAEHRADYFLLLRLMVSLALKIRDDFIYRDIA
ncbi:hypothetical protein ACI1US_02319 [Leucobacter sp. BZR 635]